MSQWCQIAVVSLDAQMWDIETVITYACLIVVNDGRQGSAQGHLYTDGHVHSGDLAPSQDLDHSPRVHIHGTVALVATVFVFQRPLWTCKFVQNYQKQIGVIS